MFIRRSLCAGAVIALMMSGAICAAVDSRAFEPIEPARWVRGVTRMVFCTPGAIEGAVAAGAQVVHTNINWPYYPLRKDGGRGALDTGAKLLQGAVDACHSHGATLVLGLTPFPSVEPVRAPPDWRVHADPSGKA